MLTCGVAEKADECQCGGGCVSEPSHNHPSWSPGAGLWLFRGPFCERILTKQASVLTNRLVSPIEPSAV